ncbi:hypothetical protein AKJ08_1945 [Vulgatibacter incomptus]|uniref:Uncharacterized protein n=1 Tax=Vulgatibacter incomptus TaxID=1391653 RepID=A0A0K1PDD9_9BACT|nr:hypothetical protein AKJ08_1945 [Vulgatibacter incomptus]
MSHRFPPRRVNRCNSCRQDGSRITAEAKSVRFLQLAIR